MLDEKSFYQKPKIGKEVYFTHRVYGNEIHDSHKQAREEHCILENL